MKKKSISGLIAISAIVMAMIFSGCIEPTTIYNIKKYPDKYIDERVTIEGRPGMAIAFYTVEGTFGDLKGFWIHDKERYGRNSIFPSTIFVAYDGDSPSSRIKDKWGRDTYPGIKVTGIVRHTYVTPISWSDEDSGDFYIDGESWEYIS